MAPLCFFRYPAQMLVFLLWAAFWTAQSHALPSEVWISATPQETTGTGTESDPFDGSTAGKFDALFGSFQSTPNLTIHLGAGTFESDVTASPGWSIQPGWVIEGAGMYETTCRMVGNLQGRHWDHEFFRSPYDHACDNVVIRDLTVDCNWPELSVSADVGQNGEKYGAIYAIDLNGSNILIENVRHTNSHGSVANGNEAFGIRLAAPSTSDVSSNTIRYCRAELPQGNYAAPFALHGWVDAAHPHLITNCSVYGNVAIGQMSGAMTGFTTGGLNGAFVKDCHVYDNSFIDCQSIFYQDTGTVDGLTVSGNTLTRGWMGIGLVADNPSWTKSNIQILENTLQLQDRVANGASLGIWAAGSVITNIIVSGNNLSFDPSGSGYPQFYSIGLSSLRDGVISNNTADEASAGTRLAEPVGAAIHGYGATMSGNKTPTGEAMTGLADSYLRPLAKALNFSTRGTVGTGENVLIQGFSVGGDRPAKVLLRAIGPSLGSELTHPVADPVISLYDSGGSLLAWNDDWKSLQESEIEATAIAPTEDKEAAILIELQPGLYTALMSGKSTALGVGLVEIYDLSDDDLTDLQNVSTRGLVGVGNNVMIGGLIVGPGQSPTIIARAIGPTLGALGIQNPLEDPLLELRDSNGALVESNDNWKDSNEVGVTATAIAPADERESAIVRQLAPGNYTTVLRGNNNTAGIALVEIYRSE
jgi:hypothetical protein